MNWNIEEWVIKHIPLILIKAPSTRSKFSIKNFVKAFFDKVFFDHVNLHQKLWSKTLTDFDEL
jgi:hypothetical protein